MEGHSRRRIAGLITAGALLAAPAAAWADDRYAEPLGNGPSGDGQCLQSDPCSIQAAVESAAVADGDRVLLLAGPYALGTDQLQITDDITIEPAPGLPRQTLTSSWAMSGGAVDVTSAAPGAILRRLVISHGGASSLPTGVQLSGATGERLYVVSDGFIACAVGDGTLRDSVCFLTAAADSSAIGAVGHSQGGGGPSSSILRNVTAVSKEPNAVGLVLNAAVNVNLSMNGLNVIAEGPGFDVFANAGANSSATITLANSNYASFDAAGGASSVTPNTVSSNQAAPPLFTNFAGNNFSQAPASPTIDAGASDALVGAFDIDDNPRSLDTAKNCADLPTPDIGAYEASVAVAGTCPPPPPASAQPRKCKKKRKKKGKAKAAAKRKKKGCKKKRKKK